MPDRNWPAGVLIGDQKFNVQPHVPRHSNNERNGARSSMTAPRHAPGHHDGKRTWEVVRDAAFELGRPATEKEVWHQVLTRFSDFKRTNVRADLAALSVNDNARGSYRSCNPGPRRTDEGHPMDQFFKRRVGAQAYFERYDPAIHGIWELRWEGSKLRPHIVSMGSESSVALAAKTAAAAGAFDVASLEDARQKTWVQLACRQGQPAFRRALLEAYEGRCAITGCSAPQALEAAHIFPYLGTETNAVVNGLVLRADLHALFDQGLIRIDASSLTVQVHPGIKDMEYRKLHGTVLRAPCLAACRPDLGALERHFRLCNWPD
jgi:hypothetical protein